MPSPVGNIRGAQNKFHLPALVNPSQNLRLYLDLVNGSSNQNEKTSGALPSRFCFWVPLCKCRTPKAQRHSLSG